MSSRNLEKLKRRLTALVMVAILFLSSAAAAESVDEAAKRLDRAEQEVSLLLEARIELEGRYEEDLAKIAALKRASSSIVNDLELKDALRSARTKAETLNSLSAQLSEAEAEASLARDLLLRSYDQRLVALERELIEASPEKQVALIETLEALQIEREACRQGQGLTVEPLELPALGDLESSDPEELRAAADELLDHEESLRKQLSALNNEIAALEQQQRLLAYAEDSVDEQSLFREDARSTKVKGSVTSSPVAANDKRNEGQETLDTAAPQHGGEVVVGEPKDPPPEDPVSNEGGDDWREDDDNYYNGAEQPETDTDALNDGVPVSEPDDQPGDEPEEIRESEPFLSPAEGVDYGNEEVEQVNADPSLISDGPSGHGDDELSRKLRNLKVTKRGLQGDLETLQDERARLERRANELGLGTF